MFTYFVINREIVREVANNQRLKTAIELQKRSNRDCPIKMHSDDAQAMMHKQ